MFKKKTTPEDGANPEAQAAPKAKKPKLTKEQAKAAANAKAAAQTKAKADKAAGKIDAKAAKIVAKAEAKASKKAAKKAASDKLKAAKGKASGKPPATTDATAASKTDAKTGKDGKAPENKKKSHVLPLILIIIVLLAGVGVFGYIEYTTDQPMNLRSKAFGAIYKLDPAYSSVTKFTETLNEREAEIAKREAELDAKEKAFDEKSEADKAALDLRTEAVAKREDDIASGKGIPIYLQEKPDKATLAAMQNLGDTYAAMDPTEAARIIQRLYSTTDMAAILNYMPAENSAAVLEKMETSVAASVTDAMMRR
ncbi:MAG: hypothetical protein LBM98_07590 [Oscillospiraceae bacterium]|jgi:flagellar motility protein MotE (MotC chaperone)|nr:hypothetical protein [Oscillospiraceae bacterium]